MLLQNKDMTIGFDATTQQGKHYSSIHVTTEDSCLVLDIAELPGGTAADYAQHVVSTIEKLAELYAAFTGADAETTAQHMVMNLSNTTTDRYVLWLKCYASKVTFLIFRCVSEAVRSQVGQNPPRALLSPPSPRLHRFCCPCINKSV
jgi:hypothetical protein